MRTFLRSQPKGLTLREMYTRPLVYGTSPSSPKWSPDGSRLAFLWNEGGEPLLDLYVGGGGGRRKLTDAAAIGPLPVEDDERPADDVDYAEIMAGGVTEFEWVGDRLAFILRGNLFWVPAVGGGAHRVTTSAQGWSALKAHPAQDKVGFLSNGNVWSYDLGSGELAQLTFFSKDQVTVADYEWSPDGRHLAVNVEDRSMYEKVKMPDYSPEGEVKIVELRRNNVGKPLSKVRVGIVPATGGKMSRINLPHPDAPEKTPPTGKAIDTGNNLRVSGLTWLCDGSRLVVAAADAKYTDYRIVLVEPGKEDEPVEIFHEVQEPWADFAAPISSPDSRHIFFASYRDGWRRVYRLAIEGGDPEPFTPAGMDVTGFAVPKLGQRVLFTANAPHPTEQHAYSVPIGGGEPERLADDGTWCDAQASDDGRQVALNVASVMRPPELHVHGEGPITHSPLAAFGTIRPPRLDRMTFVNESDGKTIHAKVILPADFDPARRYPVVLTCVYAGLGKEGFGRYQLLDTYMANEMGYILVGVDLRASMGYGKDFFYGYHRSLGIVDAEECVSCANHLRTLPYVDGERIGIWGGSYGGFLTLMAMCNHPGVFHTGVSWKPVTDWRNYWDSYTCPRLGRPDDDPEIYKATSPVFHADGLEGNLLIIHGMLDDNVLFQDAAWMIQKLIESKKYFDLMIYPRDDHGLTLRHESLPDCMERIAAYFEEHMGLGPV